MTKSGFQYLRMKGDVWYMQRAYPKDVSDVIDKGLFIVNLRTSDVRIAKKRRQEAIAEFERIVREIRTKIDPRLRDLDAEASDWRYSPVIVDQDDSDDEDIERSIKSMLITEEAERIEQSHGYGKAKRFADIALGYYNPVDAYVDLWCREAPVSPKLELQRHSDIREFIEAHPEIGLETITRRLVGIYVSAMRAAGKNPVTVNGKITNLSSYWSFMLKKGLVETDNPFRDQRLPVSLDDRSGKRPFTDEEVLILLNGIEDQMVLDAFKIGLLSGMRLSEITNLKVEDCIDQQFNIRVGKTVSSVRSVPIHSQITKIIKRRCKGKKPSQFLFDELPERDPKDPVPRHRPLSAKFTRLRRSLLGEQKRHEGMRQGQTDFHSTRRYFIDRAEKAGVYPWIIEAVVGHSRKGESLGRYSQGPSQSNLKKCVEAVKLPPEANQSKTTSSTA